jgi:hypothetical protein
MRKKIIATVVALVGLVGVARLASADECYPGNNAAYYGPTYVAPPAPYYPPAQTYYAPAPVYRPVYRAPVVRVYHPFYRRHHWGRW